jgi:3-oxoacyl-(acyl-carrier-protein) synthase
MLNNDFLAESANIKDLMDEAEGMNILTARKDGPVRRVMSNSFGFGGTNCCLIFDRHER